MSLGDAINLASTRTKQFKMTRMMFVSTPNGPRRWPYPVQPPAAKLMPVKTCLQCGARVATNPDGTVPDGAMPYGH